ncbi:hypothetical protein [Haladaptatus halobius]|uniref:hypothetical protein n=1 Tax=Haladaptatus halobius TaxID=2884875 RepID=UPI001D0AA5FF|nr:hypothetical protein [Haladaptatus halobius]
MLAFVRSGARRLFDGLATEPRHWTTVDELWVLMSACMTFIIVPPSVLPLIMADPQIGPTAAS